MNTYLINQLSVIAIDITLLIILIVLLINIKYIVNKVRSLDRKQLVAISLFIVFISVVFLFTNAPYQPSDQEWESLSLGKQLSEGNDSYVGRYRYGLLYPVLIRDFIWIFGPNPEVATIISFLSFLLIAASIFITSREMFGNRFAGIISVVLLTLSPMVITYFSVNKGHPGLGLAFFSLSLALFSLSYRRDNPYLYLLSLLSIVLMSQIKLEYGIIFTIFLIGLIIFKGQGTIKSLKLREREHLRKIIILLLIFLVFVSLSQPYILKRAERQSSYLSRDFVSCGMPKYEIAGSPLYMDKNSPESLALIDEIIKSVTNDRFGTGNINSIKIDTFYDFYNQPFILMVLIGSLFSIIGIRKRWKEILFLTLAFLVFTLIYLMDCNFFESRYAIVTIVPLFILSGYGLYSLSEFIQKRIKNRYNVANIVILIIVIISLVFSLSSGLYGKTYSNQYHNAYEMTSYIETISPNPIVLTSHMNNLYKFRFFSDFKDIYSMEFLLYVENPDYGMSYLEVYYENKSLAKEILVLPFSDDRDNFFVHGGSCLLDDYHKEACEKVFDDFVTEKAIRSDFSTLYQIVLD